MAEWLEVRRGGVRLACCDFGGRGRSVLLLHGLAGYSGEWAQTAAALGRDFRIVGLDQRGHGRSDRAPADASRAAFVADIVAVIEQISLAPVVLVGQSMGGNSAFLTAAGYPAVVDALVVVEASPDGPAPELPAHIQRWLDNWPVPFADETTARQFFSSQGLAAGAWSEGLERRDDGLWPAFDSDFLVQCIGELAARDYWSEWRRIECPTLIVRGERGNLEERHCAELADALPRGRALTIPAAGHDVHLDAPDSLAAELRRFVT